MAKKNQKIKNKVTENKKLTLKKNKTFFIILGIIFITIIILSIVFFTKKKKNTVTLAELNAMVGQEKQEIEYKDVNEELETEEIQEIQQEWKEYTNQKYDYTLKYPEKWNIFTDEANNELKKETNQEIEFLAGAPIFWSNYENIDEYNRNNKPDDFKLIAMQIYQKDNLNIEEFSKLIGFYDELKPEKIDFQAGDLMGTEYISSRVTEEGIDQRDPNLAIIFQQNNFFYVFHLGFTGGDEEIIKEIEKIAATFDIRQ